MKVLGVQRAVPLHRERAGPGRLLPCPSPPGVPGPGGSSVSRFEVLSVCVWQKHCAHVGLRAQPGIHTHTVCTCGAAGTHSSFGSPCGTLSLFLQTSPVPLGVI